MNERRKSIGYIVFTLLVLLISFTMGILAGSNLRKSKIIKDFEERITECEQEYDALNEQYTLLFYEVYKK